MSFAIAAIITLLAAPAFAQGDPAKTVEKAYKDILNRTTREQPAKKTDPWGKFTLVFLCVPISARFAAYLARTLRSASQPSDASATT
jgi:ABC-type transporter MlaC component